VRENTHEYILGFVWKILRKEFTRPAPRWDVDIEIEHRKSE
jgi:hypothetical protein